MTDRSPLSEPTAKTATVLHSIERDLESKGLFLLGGFHSSQADNVPGNAAAILMVSNGGSAMWRHFFRSAEHDDGLPDPLDRWCRRVIGDIAERYALTTVYPFDGPPWLPFQRWARRADPRLSASPLGMLIHPVYGLWWALRAALISNEPVALPKPAPATSPCETCKDRPCLTACPVGAFTGGGYAVDRCAAYLRTPSGQTCMERSCLARRACPAGQDFTYAADHAGFHMQAFSKGRTR